MLAVSTSIFKRINIPALGAKMAHKSIVPESRRRSLQKTAEDQAWTRKIKRRRRRRRSICQKENRSCPNELLNIWTNNHHRQDPLKGRRRRRNHRQVIWRWRRGLRPRERRHKSLYSSMKNWWPGAVTPDLKELRDLVRASLIAERWPRPSPPTMDLKTK